MPYSSNAELRQLQKAEKQIRIFKSKMSQKVLAAIHKGGIVKVREIMRTTRVPQAQVSRQLRWLRDADLVKGERKGPWVYYMLNRPVIENLIAGSKKITETFFSKRGR